MEKKSFCRTCAARLDVCSTPRAEKLGLFPSVLAMLSGAALGVSVEPLAWWGGALLFTPLLLWSLRCAYGKPRALRHAAWLGGVAGMVCNATALYWVVVPLQSFAHLPMLLACAVAVLLFGAQALTFAAGAWLAMLLCGGSHHGRDKIPWLFVWLSVSTTVMFAWMPMVFPWHPCVAMLAWLEWVQVADLGGQPLLDFVLMCGSGAVATACFPSTKHRLCLGTAGLLCLMAPAVYGAWRLPSVTQARAAAPRLRVGVVQPNVSIASKVDPTTFRAQLSRLRQMTQRLEVDGADLVVWPETAYPYPIARSQRHDFAGRQAMLRGGVHGPILAGATTQGKGCASWNSVIAVNHSGEFRGVADKVHPMAFGEYVPLWHWLRPLQWGFRCPGVYAGDAPKSLTLAKTRLGILNCYEDMLSEHGRALAHTRPEVLINVTNDAWFGPTSEPFLHHRVARMRSIEMRRDLVRAVNTGVSGHIAATGEVLVHTDVLTTQAFVADTAKLHFSTVYMRYGDVWVWVLFVLLIVGGCKKRFSCV